MGFFYLYFFDRDSVIDADFEPVSCVAVYSDEPLAVIMGVGRPVQDGGFQAAGRHFYGIPGLKANLLGDFGIYSCYLSSNIFGVYFCNHEGYFLVSGLGAFLSFQLIEFQLKHNKKTLYAVQCKEILAG